MDHQIPSFNETLEPVTLEDIENMVGALHQIMFPPSKTSVPSWIMLLLCSVGICLNVLNVMILSSKSIISPINTLLVALEGVNVIVFLDLLLRNSFFFFPRFGVTLAGVLLKLATIGVLSAGVTSSNWLTLAVGVWRLVAVHRPMSVALICNKTRTKYVIFVVISVSTLVAAHMYLVFSYEKQTFNVYDESYHWLEVTNMELNEGSNTATGSTKTDTAYLNGSTRSNTTIFHNGSTRTDETATYQNGSTKTNTTTTFHNERDIISIFPWPSSSSTSFLEREPTAESTTVFSETATLVKPTHVVSLYMISPNKMFLDYGKELTIYISIFGVVTTSLPCILLAGLTLLLLRSLWHAKEARNQLDSYQMERLNQPDLPSGRSVAAEVFYKERRVTIALVILVFIFCLANVPYVIINSLNLFSEGRIELQSVPLIELSMSGIFFVIFNSGTFFLYYFMSENFRKTFKEIMCVKMIRVRNVPDR